MIFCTSRHQVHIPGKKKGERNRQKETFQLSPTPCTKLSHSSWMASTRSQLVQHTKLQGSLKTYLFIWIHCLPEQNQDATGTAEGEGMLVDNFSSVCYIPPLSFPTLGTARLGLMDPLHSPSSPLKRALPQSHLFPPHCSFNSMGPVLRSSIVLNRKLFNLFPPRHYMTSPDFLFIVFEWQSLYPKEILFKDIILEMWET